MRKVALLPAITAFALGIALPLALAQNPEPDRAPDPPEGRHLRSAARRAQLPGGLAPPGPAGRRARDLPRPVHGAGRGLLEGGRLRRRRRAARVRARLRVQGAHDAGASSGGAAALARSLGRALPPGLQAEPPPPACRGAALSSSASSREATRPLAEASIGGTGARVVQRDKRALVVLATAERLDALARLGDVAWVENFVLRRKHNDKGGGVIMGSAVANGSGYDGSTQTVAIADTGIGGGTAATAHAHIAGEPGRRDSRLAGSDDFCFESIVNDGSRDVDTGHGTHVAVSVLGDGGASGLGRGRPPRPTCCSSPSRTMRPRPCSASLLYGLPSGYYLTGIPTNIGDLFQQAYAGGARIHSNSWGSAAAGQYTADSQNADAFVWAHRDMTVTFSAGNAGADANADGIIDDDSIDAPATAKNVISVGASENDRRPRLPLRRHEERRRARPRAARTTSSPGGRTGPSRFPRRAAEERPERRQRRADGRLRAAARPTTGGSSPTWWPRGRGCCPATPTSTRKATTRRPIPRTASSSTTAGATR